MRAFIVPSCLLAMVVTFAAHGDPQSHRQVARDFYEVSRPQDTTALAGAVAELAVAELIVQMQPGWRNQREIIEQYAVEMVTSDAFNEANVRVIAEMFSEEELKTLLWLFRHSAFQTYRERNAELVRRSTQVTMSLFRDSLPELERRIQADQRR